MLPWGLIGLRTVQFWGEGQINRITNTRTGITIWIFQTMVSR
jgi:hypothetical protein